MTEEEFLAIWQANAQQALPEIEYRLYHDENGFPLFYSTEDLPGLWIKISQETFLDSPKHIRIVDGKIIEAEISWTKKIVPAEQGTPCHTWDVCVVVDSTQTNTKWRLKHKDPI